MLLLNSDEEIGSPASRPITEQLAKLCAAVHVLEPAQGLAYKTARKGTGNWRIEIKGVAAHAGVDFEKGASAIRELTDIFFNNPCRFFGQCPKWKVPLAEV